MGFGDRTTVKRILAGDGEAAEGFVPAHYPGVHRFLAHLTRSKDDGYDLAQKTFVKVKERLPQFRGDCPLRSWLYRIAYGEFLHWHRYNRRHPEEGLPSDMPCGQATTDDALVLIAAIGELNEEVRTPFLLREVEMLSVREVALALDIPEGTVKSRCHLARQRLRSSLEGTWFQRGQLQAIEAEHGN